MGIWNCNRDGCDHIMPDRFNDDFGHICEWCFDELVSRSDLEPCQKDIKKFMETPKRKTVDEKARKAYLEAVFPK